MTTWQNYLLVRKNESIIKSSIPQLLEMGIDPIGFYRDVLSGQDANKAMELNEMPVTPQQGQQAMTPQQMSTVLANMIAQDKNSQVKDPNVTNSLNMAKKALDAKMLKMQQQAQQQQPAQQAQQQKPLQQQQPVQQQPVQQQPVQNQAPMPNQPVK